MSWYMASLGGEDEAMLEGLGSLLRSASGITAAVASENTRGTTRKSDIVNHTHIYKHYHDLSMSAIGFSAHSEL